MKKLFFIILILFAGNGMASSLPDCPSDQSKKYHNCFGTYTWDWIDGAQYVGEFKDGNFHGQGTYTYTSGDKYVGEFKDGNFHGQGTYTFTNGVKYAGRWIDGEFEDKSKERLAIERAEKKTNKIYNACLLDKSKNINTNFDELKNAVLETCRSISKNPSWYEIFKYNR